MIISFADQESEDIFNGVNSKKARNRLPSTLIDKAQLKLDMLNRAYNLKDLRIPPNNRLEPLKGNLAGKYSIRINDQYLIIFEWDIKNHETSQVKIVDYQ